LSEGSIADTLAITLRTDGPLSLQQQLYTRLRADILAGRLRPGEKVPATRALAAQLVVSRTTAVLAYEQLLAEGYIEARSGAGTFVSGQLPDETLRTAPTSTSPAPRRSALRRLSRWGSRVGEIGDAMLGDHAAATERYAEMPFDFRPGRPDWDAFPHAVWSRLARRHWRRPSADLASYGDPAGYRPLREAIAAHLAQSRGVRCDADQVVVVNGSQQGIDLLIRLWLDPGECAALEEPGYGGGALALRAHGVEIHPTPVDAEGLDVAALPPPDAAGAPRLVYVTPSHQFPTGATLSLPRRLRLLEWAARRGALVVEDDYDSEFRYSGRPLESLQGLDTSGLVAYVGSFTKALFPPLRVGYVVLPPGLAEPFVAAKWLADRQTATPDQQVLSDFIREGHFERHLRRMRRLYQRRRDVLLDALNRHFGELVRAGGHGAGLHLVAWLPDDWNDLAVTEHAAALGVAVLPLRPYYQGAQGKPGLMLGFAALDEPAIEEGIRRLAAARGLAVAVAGSRGYGFR
jgi:GntR family transcriptional regulator/MocR family aminotransferase